MHSHINVVIMVTLIIVLILVVMEDALAQQITIMLVIFEGLGLNPCCNGRCTRTTKLHEGLTQFSYVLILVVMEDALAQETKADTLKKKKS